MKRTKTKVAKRPRGRPAKYPAKRVTITVRLQQPIYQQVAATAGSHGRSISEEFEYRIVRSFEQDRAFPDPELHDLAVRVITAFADGGRLENPDRPLNEWINRPLDYNRAMLGAFEALMARHPHPRYTDLIKLIYSIGKRLEAVWLDMSEEDKSGLRMPTLVMKYPEKQEDKNENGQDEKS
jgi:hypothetical protein